MGTPRLTDVPNSYDAPTFRSIMRDIRRQLELISGNLSQLFAATKTSSGTVTLAGATPVNVANTAVTDNSQISLTFKTLGGTRGDFPAITPTAGVGFEVVGTAGYLSVYNYEIRG